MLQVLRFTGMLLRAYVRDRVALFFSLVVPLMLMVIFGYMNLGSFGRVTVAYDDKAKNADSARFIDALRSVDTLRLRPQDEATSLNAIRRSELDLALVIPEDFRLARGAPATVTIYGNDTRPQQVGVGRQIVREVINGMTFATLGGGPIVAVREQSVNAVRLRYVDFLVPGILGMNVMQLAIFGVAFGLVIDKQKGVLRRLMATPLEPRRFLASHVVMRLLLTVLQVLVVLGVALVLFNVQVLGGIGPLLLVSTLGGLLFLCQGFAIAGWARTENQVPAIAQLITLPQFFFSGVFFTKDAAPDVVRPITELLPLTFLNDALREISVQGASLWDVRGELAGLGIWIVASFVLAVAFFRFEKT